MDDLPPAAGSVFLRDLHAAQEVVRAGTTQDSRQQKLYKQWSDFCATLKINPALQDSSIPHVEVHSALGVLGVSDPVPINLEDLDARDG